MKKENFIKKIIRKLKELFNNGNISETRGKLSPSATLGNPSQSYTKGQESPSAALGEYSKSITEGNIHTVQPLRKNLKVTQKETKHLA